MVLKKVLLIRFSSIGDIILTTPVIRCLKQQIPDVELHVLTKSSYQNLLTCNPYVNKVFGLKDDLKNLLSELKAEQYDFVVDLHRNLRSRRVKIALRKPSASFPKLDFQKFLYTKLKFGELPDIHIVDRYFKAVEKLGVKNDGQGLDFFFDENSTTLPSEMPEKYVAVVIGGQHSTKILPAEKVIGVCRALDFPVVLVGGKEDVERGELISKSLVNNVLNTCGRFSIAQSAMVLKRAEVVLANDTGMMHIAAALRKPIVSVWGNTVPEFGMYPYLPTCPQRSCIIENRTLECRPCHKLGYRQCPKGHFACMNTLDAKEIAGKLKELMKNEKAE